jgi:glycosyltransferase involved in cell wall biosynthesis
MTPSPLISVLLPVHDAGQTLAATLRSILRQTENRWECLIVDDGSTDDSPEIARQFAEHDPRFRLVTTPHRGLVQALNTGIRECSGRYIARMDADDLMHRHRLQQQSTLLEKTDDLDAVGCHVRMFPRKDLTDGARDYERWINSLISPEQIRRDAFIECPVVHPTLMIRRELLSDLAYRDMGWPEDYDLVLRLLTTDHKVGVLPTRRLAWREHEARLWRNSPAYSPARFTDCKAAFIASSFLKDHPEYVLWGYGSTGREIRRALEQHDRRPSHIVDLHPGRLGNKIHGAKVIPPDELVSLIHRPLIVSVSGPTPRQQIRTFLSGMNHPRHIHTA